LPSIVSVTVSVIDVLLKQTRHVLVQPDKENIATKSTEKHGRINTLTAIFSCSSVDSVAVGKTGTWLDLLLNPWLPVLNKY
jgi:hypothetical protein